MSTTTASMRATTGTWSVDPARSRVGFRVKQFGVGTVRGAFAQFEGTVVLGDDLARATAYGSVSAASLDTGNERRDAHLRSPAFLDAGQHPEIAFRSSAIRRVGADTLEIAGDLTIRGATRPITLTAGVRAASDGARVEIEARGRLNRRDYGVTPNPVLDAVVSAEVELVLDLTTVPRAE